MMTEQEVRQRLELVKTANCSKDLFIELYGVDLWQDKAILGHFRAWVDLYKKGLQGVGPASANRWLFELFLLNEKVIPLKVAAIQFGMNEEPFRDVLMRMKANGWLPLNFPSLEGNCLIRSDTLRDFHKLLPGFPRRVWQSQSSFTRAFQVFVKEKLDLEVELLLDYTSQLTNTVDEPEVAYERDIITGDPIGIGHQVWLDFGKPIALKPDACSLITYVRHEDLLQEYCLTEPDRGRLAEARIYVQQEQL